MEGRIEDRQTHMHGHPLTMPTLPTPPDAPPPLVPSPLHLAERRRGIFGVSQELRCQTQTAASE